MRGRKWIADKHMWFHVDGCSVSFPECNGLPVACLKKVLLTPNEESLMGMCVLVSALEELRID